MYHQWVQVSQLSVPVPTLLLQVFCNSVDCFEGLRWCWTHRTYFNKGLPCAPAAESCVLLTWRHCICSLGRRGRGMPRMNGGATVLCFLSFNGWFLVIWPHTQPLRSAAAVDARPRLIYRSQDAAAVYTAAGGCLHRGRCTRKPGGVQKGIRHTSSVTLALFANILVRIGPHTRTHTRSIWKCLVFVFFLWTMLSQGLVPCLEKPCNLSCQCKL